MTIPLIVHGAAGRMGTRILSLAAGDPRFRIVAGVDRSAGALRPLGVDSDAPLLTSIPAEPGAVVVDFSHHTAIAGIAQVCARHGQALVSGTTGIAPAELDTALATVAGTAPALHAGNMSVGVNVLLAIAARLARTLGDEYDIEIVEAHHHLKKDAPSGTAWALADAICAATGRTRADVVHGREGDTGARTKREIGMHALRMGDVIGDHSVYFVGNGERITIGHVAHTRDLFATGALRAAAFLHGKAAGRYRMAEMLGLE